MLAFAVFGFDEVSHRVNGKLADEVHLLFMVSQLPPKCQDTLDAVLQLLLRFLRALGYLRDLLYLLFGFKYLLPVALDHLGT